MKHDSGLSSIAVKVGIAGVVGFGALATGLIISRKGRNLLREAWHGRRRTTLEDRVLEILWSDPALSRRDIDVEELDGGRIVLRGAVHTDIERRLAVALTERARDVIAVDDELQIVPPPPRPRMAQNLASLAGRARNRSTT